jgi:hypothetical protein
MNAKLALACLSFAAVDALAADANIPPTPVLSSTQSSTSAKPIAPRRVVAPTISETRATRMPDGSLAINCTDRPNPKAHALPQQTRSPQRNPDQQP